MKVYMDHSATTPLFPEVVEAITDCLQNTYGNPSSLHSFGRDANKALNTARKKVADLINAEENEIIFTSGGTEADNLAIFGTVERFKGEGHIITTAIEHHAILDSFEKLAKEGFDVTYLPVNEEGVISVEDVKAAIRPDTRLISIMHANNEVGSIMPVVEIGELVKDIKGITYHVDAVQSVGKIKVDVKEIGCDMLSYSSHKINGPKGIGALYIKRGTRLNRRAFGGGQERKIRSGTENLPGIVGFGVAAEMTGKTWEAKAVATREMCAYLKKEIAAKCKFVYFNGPEENRLPHNLHVSFPYIEGEALLMYMDIDGIAVSSGSACSASDFAPSHVLRAMNLPEERMQCAIRMTLGLGNTREQLDQVVESMATRSNKLLEFSPFVPRD